MRFALLLLALSAVSHARITKIIFDRVEAPTFAGQSFGDTGRYEKIVGRAFGEIDPLHPRNAGITDIMLVPRVKGEAFVHYETTFYLLKPVDAKKGNGLLFWSAPNRGDKRGFNALNQGLSSSNDPVNAGDGLALRRGYSILWSGWQADVDEGNNRMLLKVPAAKNPDGSDLTGPVRMELIPTAAMNTWDYAAYPPVDGVNGVLTAREKEADARRVIPASEWSYGNCATKPFPGDALRTQLCLRGGFSPNLIYEFIYTAKDPLVLGLGMAATRDLVSWFRRAERDDSGTPNPLAGAIRAAIGEGQSQAGRFLRTFLDLGFNQDEFKNIVFEGMNPHIASQGVPVNVRFGQPDRSMGQRENALYPAPEGPLTWNPVLDPLAGRWAGMLDACRETLTCPKIIQTTSGTEYWQGRMSLNTTNWNGTEDVALPDNVRLYHFASTQHTPTASNNPGMCQLIQNPAPFFETRRALLDTIRPQHLIVKPALLGGFTAAEAWIADAEARGIQWWTNSLLESNIGLSAICQWTAALGEAHGSERIHGLGTGALFTNNFPSPIRLAGSRLIYDRELAWNLPSPPRA